MILDSLLILWIQMLWIGLQEAMVLPPWVGFAVRPRPGIWEYVRINVEELLVEELSVTEYLGFKESLTLGSEYVP